MVQLDAAYRKHVYTYCSRMYWQVQFDHFVGDGKHAKDGCVSIKFCAVTIYKITPEPTGILFYTCMVKAHVYNVLLLFSSCFAFLCIIGLLLATAVLFLIVCQMCFVFILLFLRQFILCVSCATFMSYTYKGNWSNIFEIFCVQNSPQSKNNSKQERLLQQKKHALL